MTTQRLLVVSMIVALLISTYSGTQLLGQQPPGPGTYTHANHKCKITTCSDVYCLDSVCGGNRCISYNLIVWRKCLPEFGETCTESGLYGSVTCVGLCETIGGFCSCVYGVCSPNFEA